MIRLSMLKILLGREFMRLKKNPSALLLLGMLAAVALLMATSRPVEKPQKPVADNFWLIYDRETAWIHFLGKNRPEHPSIKMLSRQRIANPDPNGRIALPPGDCGLEIKHENVGEEVRVKMTGLYFGPSSDIMDPLMNWFWPKVVEFQDANVKFDYMPQMMGGRRPKTMDETSLSELVKAEVIGTVLLLIVQFFTCCHLLVSFTSQDRERGTLTALVLSPARMSEILVARFIFHLALSMVGSVAVIAILQPAALARPVLWATLFLTSIGLMSVGTCIATLAKTQSSAALLGLCYMLGGAVLFYLSTKFIAFGLLKKVAFESYSFLLIYQTLKTPLGFEQAAFLGLGWLIGIVVVWVYIARTTFYRFGWR